MSYETRKTVKSISLMFGGIVLVFVSYGLAKLGGITDVTGVGFWCGMMSFITGVTGCASAIMGFAKLAE